MKRIVFLFGLLVALAVSPSIAEARGCRSSSCGSPCSAPVACPTPCVVTPSCGACATECGHHGRMHARRGRVKHSCGSSC